jgi:ribosome biogenesis GTPase / thiamine phosphate phosphatase
VPKDSSHMLITLRSLGYTDEVATSLDPAPGLVPGRVSRVDKGLCTVLTNDGPLRASWSGGLLAEIAKNAQATPCTGDWVALRQWPDDPVTVERVARRRTAIVRAEVSGTSRGQVLAANVDVVAIVVGLHPEPNLGRIERFVALAWDSGAEPLVVLTKADLVPDAAALAADVTAAAPGAGVRVCSTVTGEGLDGLRSLLGEDRTMAMLGASGAGKSSLINALAGAEVLDVQEIRADGKGRHTSVRRELVPLPGGGVVIDTPGLRGIGLQEGEGLAAVFTDIEELAAQCRFDDCAHDTEPGCAVRAALENGTLPVRRYESWLKLRRKAAWMARRADARLRAEVKKEWKQRTKAYRRDITPR